MANVVSDYVLDNGLTVLDTDAVGIYICSADPTTYAEATATYALGHKTWAAGGAWGSPAAASPSGQKVSSTPITDGVVTANGTAAKWATVDGSRLLANGSLQSSMAVLSGNTFTLGSFDVSLPGQ